MKSIKKTLGQIACDCIVTVAMRGGTLEARYNDEEDFIDVSVGELETALRKAYEAGRASAKK
ncbi:DUF6900 domain-containing protein [Selenomonas bovis]|uniref:DUF6900 domain-containing protein n=1 Tax=Selenomonas bovis TaxID=416586 RepID=UPI003D08BF16